MKNIMTGTYFKGEESFNFNFATDLSMAKKAIFVNSVVDIVVDDITKRYNSILRNLIVDFYIIKYFTDIDIAELETSDSFVDDVEQFLEETNVVEIVKANVLPTLFDELDNAIDNSIEYITGIHRSPIADALSSLLYTLEKKIGEFDTSEIMDMAQKFTNMTDELTPDSIVNAYINSDMHKANLEEVTKSKIDKVKIAENLDKAIKEVNKESKTKKKSKSKN